MKFLVSLAVTGTLLSCAPAMAEDIDLSSWTCKQFLAAAKEDVGVILAWLDGYYKEEDEPPVINTEALVTQRQKKTRPILRRASRQRFDQRDG